MRCSVKGTWWGTAKRDAPRNEFDLLVVARNRMLVVECKTLRLGQDPGQEKGEVGWFETDRAGGAGQSGASQGPADLCGWPRRAGGLQH